MTPGCINGRLLDPQSYFFSLIGSAAGRPAPDWKPILEDLHFNRGMWKNPAPGAPVAADAPFYGITVMIDAGNNSRGRIWLPADTFTVDDNGNRWFTREVQVIADGPTPGSYVWAWQDKGGAPYAPRACDGTTQPPVEPPTTPPSDHEARILKLEQQVAALTVDVANAAKKGGAVEVKVGSTWAHSHGATGKIL